MEHPDLVAVLHAYQRSPGAVATIAASENAWLHIPPRSQEEPLPPSLRSRDPTPELEEGEDEYSNYLDHEALQLTFSHRPKNGNQGFCLGRDRSRCDIYIPTLATEYHISTQHFFLTFDNQNRLILRDRSRNGTIVTYDGKGGKKRRNFRWILAGDPFANDVRKIVVRLNPQLQFIIIVSKAWMGHHPAQYISKVEQFRNELTASTEPFIGGLGLQSQTTTAPIKDPLGAGGFGTVTLRWDVSTGHEYACKKPHTLDPQRLEYWEKEIRIMGQIKHENIVKFHPEIKLGSGSVPCLFLDYLPLGNLGQQHWKQPFSYKETLIILRQCLSALKFLHEQNPPIAHRDLKLENILVRERYPLHVQLADFGLAKEGSLRTGKIGTETYFPPEYFESCKMGKYSVKIDIWSLGLVALDLTHSLPEEDVQGIRWCEKIIDRANQYKNEGLMEFLTIHMLVLKPGDRSSADICLKAVEHLRAPSRDGSVTPTQASLAGKAPLTRYNALSGMPLNEQNASFPANDVRQEPRKRPVQSRSSSGAARQTKRPARMDSSNSPRPHTEDDSVDRLFTSRWWENPMYVGSDVAAMGREDPSGWNSGGSNTHSTIKNATGNQSFPSNVGDRLNGPVRASEHALSNSEAELMRQLQAGYK
ncbi:serine/threonine protein kinase [Blastomyces parvus]|uniref:Serine/threonine protein kinase n=1 Tax=Blastomyces parvus TaxID=2060905 RepID=A0A2B7WNJ7_9EURO|nr:serine/threonine protein kinase [Blastomyces parvus]